MTKEQNIWSLIDKKRPKRLEQRLPRVLHETNPINHGRRIWEGGELIGFLREEAFSGVQKARFSVVPHEVEVGFHRARLGLDGIFAYKDIPEIINYEWLEGRFNGNTWISAVHNSYDIGYYEAHALDLIGVRCPDATMTEHVIGYLDFAVPKQTAQSAKQGLYE